MKLFDGTLQQKTGENFNQWYARFVGATSRLDLSDTHKTKHIYRLLRSRFSSALANGAGTKETSA